MNTLNLQPAFYRPPGSRLILSGWRAVTTGDIYCVDEAGTGYALVAGAREALRKGDRVMFRTAVDLHPTDYIEPKERGIVSHVDEASGTVSVLLEGLHMGLGDNTLTLTPHQDDEVVASLEHFKPPRWFYSARLRAFGWRGGLKGSASNKAVGIVKPH